MSTTKGVKEWLRGPGSTWVFVALVVCFLLLCIAFYQRRSEREFERGLAGTSAEKGSSVGSRNKDKKHDDSGSTLAFPSAQQTSQPASEVERLLTQAVQETETGFRELERQNTVIIGVIEGEKSRQTLALISQPTQDQYDEYYRRLKVAFGELPPSISGTNRVEDAKVKLLNNFAKFNTPFKVINYINNVEQGEKPNSKTPATVIQTFVRSRESVVINGDTVTMKDFESERRLGPEAASRYAYVLQQ
jgi:hypothetical protein